MDQLAVTSDSRQKLSIDLNDDLDSDAGSFISHGSNNHTTRRPVGTNSIRTSIDDSFSSAYLQNFDDNNRSEFSPLGNNSIYELTIASDNSRDKKRTTKYQVTLNGGNNTIYNVKTPTTREIPPIQLEKIGKIDNKTLLETYNYESDYKKFDENKLTMDSLQKLNQGDFNLDHDDSSMNELDLINENTNESIPEIFGDENFRLDDPRIFNKVMGDFEIDSETNNLNNNLQEKLTHYLDLVEISLINEISKSSDSFFSTIDDIKMIQHQSNDNLQQFQIVNHQVDELLKNNQQGLKILTKISKRNNIENLENSMIQLTYILETFEIIKKLSVSNDRIDIDKCLHKILETEKLIDELNFNKLPALINLIHDLQFYKNNCLKKYSSEFINLLLVDLRSHYQNENSSEVLTRLYSKRQTSGYNYQVMNQDLKDKLSSFIENLIKSNNLIETFQSYHDKIINEIKDIIKVNLPRSSSSDSNSAGITSVTASGSTTEILSNPSSTAPSRSSSLPPDTSTPAESLSNSIKNLTPVEFENMLIKIFVQLSECLRRLTVQAKILLDLSLRNLTEDLDVMSLDLTIAINKSIELTQLRLSKIFNVRSEQIADSSVAYYFSFYSLVSKYLQECELINPGYLSSSAGSSLNDWIKNHGNYFVHRFHSNHLKLISSEIDKEIWKETNHLNPSLIILNSIINSDEDTSKYLQYPFDHNQYKQEIDNLLDKITIDNEQFMVPKFITTVIESVHDYLTIASIFNHHKKTIENNILNFFKLTNSKILQSVLNAGATRTAGLKHITTKHLALTIQTIEFMIKFIDLTSTKFSETIIEDDLTFNKLLDLYKDHESQLSAKLISIMYDRTVNHCQAILKINWSESLDKDQQCHKYMEILVKETLTVAKVLTKYLSPIKYSIILSEIFNNYKKLLIDCFINNLKQFNDFNEKYKLLKDIDYFRVKLCDVPGYSESGQVIWENVNNLPTIEDTKMEEIMKNNIEGERSNNTAQNEILFETPNTLSSEKVNDEQVQKVDNEKDKEIEKVPENNQVKENHKNDKTKEVKIESRDESIEPIEDVNKNVEREIIQAELQEKESIPDLVNDSIMNDSVIDDSVINNSVNQDLNNNEQANLKEEKNKNIEKVIEVNDVKEDVKDDVKDDVKEDVKDDVKEHVKDDVKEDVREDVKEDVREDVKDDIKEDVKEDINDDTKKENIDESNNFQGDNGNGQPVISQEKKELKSPSKKNRKKKKKKNN